MDIKTFYESNKRNCIVLLIAIVISAACYIMFCGTYHDGSTVPAINDITANTRHDMEQAGEQLNTVERGISNSQEKLGNVQNGIDESTVRIGHIIESNKGSQGLVKEGRGTTDSIRKLLESLSSKNGKESKGSN